MMRIVAAAVLLAVIAADLIWALPGRGLMDYGSFIASGQAAAAGLDPYGIYPLTLHVVLPGFESWNPNLNPPSSLPLFALLAKIDPAFGMRLWQGFSLACYALAVWLLLRRYCPTSWLLPLLWMLALAGFWDSLVLGQIYLPLVLAAVGAWLLLDHGRPVPAGLLIGLVVAAKPNFLVWPALLVLAGHYRPAAAALLSAALLCVLPVLLYGPHVYGQWIDLLLRDSDRAAFLTNASLPGLAQRLGAPSLGWLLSLMLLGGLAVWARWRRPSPLEAGLLGLTAALLASPIAWVHYTLFLLPVFFLVRSSPLLRASAALLVVPVPVVLDFLGTPWWLQASAGSVYGWAVVLCLAAVFADQAAGRSSLRRRAKAIRA